MQTLPQPKTFPCESCGDPIDILYVSWDQVVDPHDFDTILALFRCPKHWTHQDVQEEDVQEWFDRHRTMRREIGNPPGTLLVIENLEPDRNARGSSRGFSGISRHGSMR
jgi:hypothetical protein